MATSSAACLRVLAVLATGALLGGCGGSTEPKGPGYPASLQIVAGDQQSGTVGTELPNPLVIKVVDSAGAPVGGQIVNFRVTSGGGSVFAGVAISTTSGLAQERWTLGTSTADSQEVEARAVDPLTGAPITFAVFQATALPDVPAAVVRLAGDSQVAPVRTAVPVVPSVRVADRFRNPVSGVAVTFAVTSGGGAVTGAAPTTNDSGVATVGSWKLGPAAGTNVLTASAAGATSATFTATGTGGVPTAMSVVAGDGQTAVAGTSVSVRPG